MSYHAASAAAGAIAISHALQSLITAIPGGSDARSFLEDNLAAYMGDVDVVTFYGRVSFAANGAISGKPMYTERN